MQTFLLVSFFSGASTFFLLYFSFTPVYIGILLDSEDKPRTVRFLGRRNACMDPVKTLFIAGISCIFFILGLGRASFRSYY